MLQTATRTEGPLRTNDVFHILCSATKVKLPLLPQQQLSDIRHLKQQGGRHQILRHQILLWIDLSLSSLLHYDKEIY